MHTLQIVISKTIQIKQFKIRDIVAVQYGLTIHLCLLCIIYIFNKYYMVPSASVDLWNPQKTKKLPDFPNFIFVNFNAFPQQSPTTPDWLIPSHQHIKDQARSKRLDHLKLLINSSPDCHQ